MELEAHLEENILGEAGEEKALARGLWRTHGRALRLAMEHRPRLNDIRDEYVALLNERFEDARFGFYPEKGGDLNHIKMNLRSWDERGFPFTFLLHTKYGRRPHARVLIWQQSYEKRADSLVQFPRPQHARARA